MTQFNWRKLILFAYLPLSIFLLQMRGASAETPIPDPIVRWGFEEGSGTITHDNSGNEHTARLVNSPTFSADTPSALGASSYAITLDGNNDYILADVSDAFEIADQFTMAGWIKLTDASGEIPIVGRASLSNVDPTLANNQGYYLSVINNQLKPEVWYEDGTSTWTTMGDIPSGEWTHIAFTWARNGQMIGYVNGEQVGTIGTPDKAMGIACTAICQVVMGAVPWAPTQGFILDGSLDDIQIFDVALTGDEVKRLTNTLVPSDPTSGVRSLSGNERATNRAPGDIVAYYPFNRGDFHSNDGSSPANGTWDEAPSGTFNDLIVVNSALESTDTPYMQFDTNEKALTLDGSLDQYLDSTDETGFDLLDTYSLAGWVKLDNVSGTQTLIGRADNNSGSNSGGYLLGVKDGAATASAWDTTGNEYKTDGGTISANEWTHLAVTWEKADKMRLYVNGLFVSETIASPNQVGDPCQVSGFDCSLIVGGRPWAPTQDNITGDIDELYVFSTELTPSDVLWLAGQRTSAPIGQPVGYWRFDEGSGSVAVDSSGNNNDGAYVQTTAYSTEVPTYPSDNSSRLEFVGNEPNYFDANYVKVPRSAEFDLQSAITLAAWVKKDPEQSSGAGPFTHQIVGMAGYRPLNAGGPNKTLGYYLGITDSKIYPEVFTQDGRSNYFTSGFIPDGVWTHVAFTWEQGEYMVAYINGFEVDRTAANNSPIALPHPLACDDSAATQQPADCDLIIGALPWSSPISAFDGGIDEVMMFDYALDGDQIYALTNENARPGDTYTEVDDDFNEPPNAVPDSAETDEDTPVSIDVLVNDTDAENDVFTISVVGDPAHGTTAISGGEVLYTPDPNYAGTDQFYYMVSQAGQPPQPGKVTVTVFEVNDLPTTASLASATVTEHVSNYAYRGAFIGLLSSDDPDAISTVSWSLKPGHAANAGFRVQQVSPGSLIGMTPDDYNFGPSLWAKEPIDHESTPTINVIVRMTEDGNDIDTTFPITVVDVNDPPTDFVLTNNSINENVAIGTVVGSLTAVDIDSIGQTFRIYNAGSDSMPFDIQNGNQIVTTAALDYEQIRQYFVLVLIDDIDVTSITADYIYVNDVADTGNALVNCAGNDISLFNTAISKIKIKNIAVSNVTPEGCDINGQLEITAAGETVTSSGFQGKVNDKDRVESSNVNSFSIDVAGLSLQAKQVSISYNGSQPRLNIGEARLAPPASWGDVSVPLKDDVTISASGINFGAEFELPTITTGNGLEFSLSGGLEIDNGIYAISAGGYVSIPNVKSNKACGIGVNVTVFLDANGRTVMEVREESVLEFYANVGNGRLTLQKITAGAYFDCEGAGIPIANTGVFLNAISGEITVGGAIEDFNLQLSATVADKAGVVQLEGGLEIELAPITLSIEAAVSVFDIKFAETSASFSAKSFSFSLKGRYYIATLEITVDAWTDVNNKFHFTGSGTARIELEKGSLIEKCYDTPRFVNDAALCKTANFGAGKVASGIKELGFTITDEDDFCEKAPEDPNSDDNVCFSLPWFTYSYDLAGIQFGEFNDGTYGFAAFVNLPKVGSERIGVSFGGLYGFRVDTKGNIQTTEGSKFVLATKEDVRAAREARRGATSSIDDGYTFGDDDSVVIHVPFEADINGRNSRMVENVSGGMSRALPNIEERNVTFSLVSTEPAVFDLIAPGGAVVNAFNYHTNPLYDIEYQQVANYVDDDGTRYIVSPTRLRVALASPTTAYENVDVFIDGTLTWGGLSYTDPASFTYVDLVPGTYTVELREAGTSNLLMSQPVTLADGEQKTALVYGTSPQMTVLIDDNSPVLTDGVGKLRIINGAAGSGLKVAIDGTVVQNVSMGSVVNYITLEAGEHTIELRKEGVGNERNINVMPSLRYDIADGDIVTLVSADYAQTVDSVDYSADVLALVDADYTREIVTNYIINDLSMAQDWDVVINGSTDIGGYVVAVTAPDVPAELADMTVDVSTPAATELSWKLTSNYDPTLVRVFMTEGPITQSVTVTDTNGIPGTQVVPRFGGREVAQYTISAGNELDGSVTTRTLDLSDLESDDYYIWFEADDGINPAVRGYGTPTGGSRSARAVLQIDETYGINSVDIASDNYDEVFQQRNALSFTVDQTADYPTFWAPVINTNFDAAAQELYVEWDAHGHPDIDRYELEVTKEGEATPLVFDLGQAIADTDINGNPIAREFNFYTLRSIEPGLDYDLVVRAIDDDNSLSVATPGTQFSRPTGDFELSDAHMHQMDAGTSILAPISLDISSPLYYGDVFLRVDAESLPAGLIAYFDEAKDGPVVVSGVRSTVNLIVDAGPNVPDGIYEAVVFGRSGAALERSEVVLINVGQVVPLTIVMDTAGTSNTSAQVTVMVAGLLLAVSSIALRQRRKLS